MKPQTTKKKKKVKKDVETEKLTDKELQKQLFPGLAIPNNPDIARVTSCLFLEFLIDVHGMNEQCSKRHSKKGCM